MEAAFGEVVVCADFEAPEAIVFSVFVGDDDGGEFGEFWVVFGLVDEVDAIHAGHVDVGDQEIVLAKL